MTAIVGIEILKDIITRLAYHEENATMVFVHKL